MLVRLRWLRLGVALPADHHDVARRLRSMPLRLRPSRSPDAASTVFADETGPTESANDDDFFIVFNNSQRRNETGVP